MATTTEPTRPGYERTVKGTGWLAFAGIMLLLVAFFNVIAGIAAITHSDYLADRVLFANLDAWGWFFVIWGTIQLIAAVGIFTRSRWAVALGLLTAFFNAVAQVSWSGTYPVWAVSAMTLDILVIYGLIVYGRGPVLAEPGGL
jgi:hypothetical protein